MAITVLDTLFVLRGKTASTLADKAVYVRRFSGGASYRSGGLFYLDSDDITSPDDGIVVILDSTSPTPRRWKRDLSGGQVDAYMAGAWGDGSVSGGVVSGTDDTAAVQRLLDYLKAAAVNSLGAVKASVRIGDGVFRIGNGTFDPDGGLDLTGLRQGPGWGIDGAGAILLGSCPRKPVLDMTDSRLGTITGLQIYGDKAAMPECGIKIGRKEDNRVANGHNFYRAGTGGYYKLAGLLNIASEQFLEIGCEFINEAESNADEDVYGYYADAFNSAEWMKPLSITAISLQSPPVVTTSRAHSYSQGDSLMLLGVTGLEQGDALNSMVLQISNVTTTTFTLDGKSEVGAMPYTGGGRVFKQRFPSSVTTTLSPWTQHSHNEQTHIATRFGCLKGKAAIFEGGEDFHSYQHCFAICGFYDFINSTGGKVTAQIDSITKGTTTVVAFDPATTFQDGELVRFTGVDSTPQANEHLYRLVRIGTGNTFQLKDWNGSDINSSSWPNFSKTGARLATKQATNGGNGIHYVVSTSGAQGCEFDIHHEGGTGNGTIVWAYIDGMQALRDQLLQTPTGPIDIGLDEVKFKEIAAGGEGGFLQLNTATVATAKLHAGEISVSGFRSSFGGESQAHKLLMPEGGWSVRGSGLFLESATVDIALLIQPFSGRLYIDDDDRYLDKSSELVSSTLETSSFKSVGIQDTDPDRMARMLEVRQDQILLGQDSASFTLRRGINTQDLFISGSSSPSAGGAVRVTGSQGTEAERVELITSNTVRMRVENALVTALRPVKLATYTIANLPTPTSGNTGAIAWCSNAAGGARVVYSDGTYWRFVDGGAVVS